MNIPLETNPQELFTLIGEREFIKYKQQVTIASLLTQIDEMAATITQLRGENEVLNGRLEQSNNHNTVRRVRKRGQGQGRRLGNDVPQRPDEPADGGRENGPVGVCTRQTTGE